MKLESKHHSIINHHLTHFCKTFKNHTNSHHNSMIMITQGLNHQQQHLIITTTSIKYEFINNTSTTISYSTNFE